METTSQVLSRFKPIPSDILVDDKLNNKYVPDSAKDTIEVVPYASLQAFLFQADLSAFQSGDGIKLTNGQIYVLRRNGLPAVEQDWLNVGIAGNYHTHTLQEVVGLGGALQGKQATLVSGSNIRTVNGQTLLGSTNLVIDKQALGLGLVDNTQDLNKPISTQVQTQLNGKAQTVHTHVLDDVPGLSAILANKAGLVHTHPISNITGLADALAGKAPAVHTHTIQDVQGLNTGDNLLMTAAERAALSGVVSGPDMSSYATKVYADAAVSAEAQARATADAGLIPRIPSPSVGAFVSMKADGTLEDSGYDHSDFAQADAFNAEIDNRVYGDNALDARVTPLESSVASHGATLTSYGSRLTSVEGALTTETSDRNSADAALAGVDALLSGRISVLESAQSGYVTTSSLGTTLTSYATKSYVDNSVSSLVGSAPETLNTLAELSAALNGDASFAASVATSLANRLRVDTQTQGLTSTQQTNVLSNIGWMNGQNIRMVRPTAADPAVAGRVELTSTLAALRSGTAGTGTIGSTYSSIQQTDSAGWFVTGQYNADGTVRTGWIGFDGWTDEPVVTLGVKVGLAQTHMQLTPAGAVFNHSPSALTPDSADNSTKLATTQFVKTQVAQVTVIPTWGTIAGTLSTQTDLAQALAQKVATVDKGQINGVAPLNSVGQIDNQYIPYAIRNLNGGTI